MSRQANPKRRRDKEFLSKAMSIADLHHRLWSHTVAQASSLSPCHASCLMHLMQERFSRSHPFCNLRAVPVGLTSHLCALQQVSIAKEMIATVFRWVSPYVGLEPDYEQTMVGLVRGVEQEAHGVFDQNHNVRNENRNIYKLYCESAHCA